MPAYKHAICVQCGCAYERMPIGGMQFYTYNDRQMRIINEVHGLGSNAEMTPEQRVELQRANGRPDRYIRRLDDWFETHDVAKEFDLVPGEGGKQFGDPAKKTTMRLLDADAYECLVNDDNDGAKGCCGWWGFWRSREEKQRRANKKREKRLRAKIAALKATKFEAARRPGWASACAICNCLMTSNTSVCAVKCPRKHVVHTACAPRLSLDKEGKLQCPCCLALV